MLTIRHNQLAALEKDIEVRFKEALAAHLLTFLGARGILQTEAELRLQVDRGMEQCPDFGLELGSHIARLFEIVCGSAGGFTGQRLPKEALNILYAYRVDPALKLERLQAWADRRNASSQP